MTTRTNVREPISAPGAHRHARRQQRAGGADRLLQPMEFTGRDALDPSCAAASLARLCIRLVVCAADVGRAGAFASLQAVQRQIIPSNSHLHVFGAGCAVDPLATAAPSPYVPAALELAQIRDVAALASRLETISGPGTRALRHSSTHIDGRTSCRNAGVELAACPGFLCQQAHVYPFLFLPPVLDDAPAAIAAKET